jgi:hypothetical protein
MAECLTFVHEAILQAYGGVMPKLETLEPLDVVFRLESLARNGGNREVWAAVTDRSFAMRTPSDYMFGWTNKDGKIFKLKIALPSVSELEHSCYRQNYSAMRKHHWARQPEMFDLFRHLYQARSYSLLFDRSLPRCAGIPIPNGIREEARIPTPEFVSTPTLPATEAFIVAALETRANPQRFWRRLGDLLRVPWGPRG